MNIRRKYLSGLLLSAFMLATGLTGFKAIAHETEKIIQTSTERSISEYANNCQRWQGNMTKFFRRLIDFGWFDFSDSRWAGKPVKEVDFWYLCMRNTNQFEAIEDASREELGNLCDRIGEDFHKNWFYFPQFSTANHEFTAEKIGEDFHLYSCRIRVKPLSQESDLQE